MSDYANHLYPGDHCLGEGIRVKRRTLTVWNCLTAPFSGAKTVHLQHEYSILGFAGCWGFLLLLYLLSLRLTGGKLVITLHTVYDWNHTEQLFAHRTRSRLLLRILSLYGRAYHRLILAAARLLIFLSDTSRLAFLRVTPAANAARMVTIPIGVYDLLLPPHPDPLPKEREQQVASPEPPDDLRCADRLATISPLPAGESRGEGVLRERYALQETDYVLTLFGFAYPNKGYHLAVEALNLLRSQHPNVRLLIVSGEPAEGGRQYLDELKQLVARHQLNDCVTFTGYIPTDDPGFDAVLLRTDCFLYPYLRESATSGSLATTLCARKVYITSDLGMFQDFTPGIKFHAGQVMDLAEKIKQAMQMGSAEMGRYRNELESYIANHNIPAMRTRHAETFLGLLK